MKMAYSYSSSVLISVLILLCYTGGKCLIVKTSVGDATVLPCEIDPNIYPNINLTRMTLEWNRTDLPQDQYVHFQRKSKEHDDGKNSSYVGRTSVFMDEFKKGNVSLKLSRVKSSDEGNYTCSLPEFNKNFTVQLIVVPRQITAVDGEDVVLPCKPDFTVPVSATVKWTRKDLTPQNVHVIKNGQEVSVEQNPVYKNRTSAFVEEFGVGNVSLRISGVKLSDGGVYTCSITSGKVEECVVQLIVGERSSDSDSGEGTVGERGTYSDSGEGGHFPCWGHLIPIIFISGLV